jgi:ParB-like chromosome segregation protein Spo0J
LEIGSSNLKFHISLVEIDYLKPHEEVIDTLVKSLANTIRSQGIVRDPIMVDQKEHVILDGMHRYGSLKLLKCRFAPCCLVDYDNPQIKVDSWFRLFATKQTESLVRNLLKENKTPYVEQRTPIANARLDSRTVIFTKDGNSYRLEQSSDPIELTKSAVRLERALSARGYHVDYLSENVAFQRLKSGKVDLVIAIPVFTKEQIREFGLQRLLLPHKVTRHVMPSRPLRLNVPLRMLMQQNISQVDADQELRALLSSRKIERKPPGSVVDGRRYEEELLVFTA